jgi:hypothetical protein
MGQQNRRGGIIFSEVGEMKEIFNGLIPKIQEAIIEDYQNIQKQVGDEEIYTAVLATCGDCTTLGLWANTVEYMEKADIKYAESIREFEERFPDKNRDFVKTTRWFPDEWGYDNTTHAFKMTEVCELLDSIYDEVPETDEVYDEYCRLFIETITTAFANVIQSNAFGIEPEKITCFIHMTDDDRACNIAKDSARVLNSPKMYEQFLEESRF